MNRTTLSRSDYQQAGGGGAKDTPSLNGDPRLNKTVAVVCARILQFHCPNAKRLLAAAVGINSTTVQPVKPAYHFKVESLSGLVIAPNIEIPLNDPNPLDEFLIDALKGINSKKQLENPPDSFKFHDEYGNPMNFTNLTTEKTITVRVVAIFWTFAKRSAMFDIKEGIFSLRLAGQELRADREVALAAARKDWSEYKYASDLLWADIDFVRQAFKHYPFILRWASRECVLAIVSEKGK